MNRFNLITLLIIIIFRFWGWGGEDDDLFARLNIKGYKPKSIEDNFGRFMVRNLISLCKEFDFKMCFNDVKNKKRKQ